MQHLGSCHDQFQGKKLPAELKYNYVSHVMHTAIYIYCIWYTENSISWSPLVRTCLPDVIHVMPPGLPMITMHF